MRHIIRDTITTLRCLIARALNAVAPAVEDIAKQLALSSSALRRYRLGNRTPPAKLVRSLARLLRARAEELERLAAQLDQAATNQEDAHGKD